ncbi:hypothetical protein LCGC14_1482160 [marine sediment metagenome]|uniref:Uncharacterized protein n=1 Tax=marine sediment metagenome TaxID=412755 RepID=A0A0F9J991_9ZZZZ
MVEKFSKIEYGNIGFLSESDKTIVYEDTNNDLVKGHVLNNPHLVLDVSRTIKQNQEIHQKTEAIENYMSHQQKICKIIEQNWDDLHSEYKQIIDYINDNCSNKFLETKLNSEIYYSRKYFEEMFSYEMQVLTGELEDHSDTKDHLDKARKILKKLDEFSTAIKLYSDDGDLKW